jgi:hypothetical protein
MSGLSVSEQIELSHLEQDIEAGREASLKMARALLRIREGRLYRGSHPTFEAYCQQRWGFGDRNAQLLISFAKTVDNLEGRSVDRIPANERQTRPIASLPADEQVEAWEAAGTLSGGNPTSAHTARAAAAVKAKATPPEPGQKVTVLDEDSDYYGQTVEVIKAEGVIIQARTEQGDTIPILTHEIAPDAGYHPTPQPSSPAPTKPNPIENLDFKLRLAEAANTHLEQEVDRLKNLLKQAIALFESYDFEDEQDVQKWLTEAKQSV